MRIFHINMHLKWGGQPNRVLTTAVGLRSRGHEVVVSGPRGAMLCQRARDAGLSTFEDLELRRGFRPFSMRKDVAALEKHFRERQYDVVDTHGSQDTWAVAFALRRLAPAERPAFIRTRHNTFPVKASLANKWLYRQIGHVITISPQVIPLMRDVFDESRCTSIYSAPDPARFDVGDCRAEVRKELGFLDEHQVIGVVGRLAPEKGHRYLITALHEILKVHPDARLLFVGTGRSRPAIELQLREMHLQDRVVLTGFRNDVPRLLQAMDLFVLPPDAGESLGTSILEAFLMERPVVATDVGGVRESVRDRETGRLVPPANPKALGDAIIEMLNNPQQGKEWALAGKRLVESSFTPEKIGEQTELVYKQMLGER